MQLAQPWPSQLWSLLSSPTLEDLSGDSLVLQSISNLIHMFATIGGAATYHMLLGTKRVEKEQKRHFKSSSM